MRCGGWRGGRRLALALLALGLAAGCVHEEIRPVRETLLAVGRAGDDVTLSWTGVRGMYYSVMYTDRRGGGSQWKYLPDAVDIPAMVTGEPILVKDRVAAGKPRYYRLTQSSQPRSR